MSLRNFSHIQSFISGLIRQIKGFERKKKACMEHTGCYNEPVSNFDIFFVSATPFIKDFGDDFLRIPCIDQANSYFSALFLNPSPHILINIQNKIDYPYITIDLYYCQHILCFS